MNLIDTHSHLYSDEFKEDIEQVIARSRQNGVSKILLPNVDIASIQALHQLVERDSSLFYPMMGLHPCSVEENYKDELHQVESLLKNGKYVAVGEIGLDYYWDITFKEQQKEALKTQIGWAKDLNLPIAIHTRNSFEDAVEILKELKDENLKGVFHCFNGTDENAREVIDLGFYMGIGGVVTFKNSGLDKVVERIDLKHLILETDSPYLAPVPHRGKRNESSYTRLVAQKVAEVKGITIEEVAEVTTQNATNLFNLS